MKLAVECTFSTFDIMSDGPEIEKIIVKFSQDMKKFFGRCSYKITNPVVMEKCVRSLGDIA